MTQSAYAPPWLRKSWAIVIAVATSTAALLAQSSPYILRDRLGNPACVVSRIVSGRTVTDRVLVYVRAPAPPILEVLERLPPDKRDFSTLPVWVTLLRLTGTAGTSAPVEVRPWSIDPSLVQPPVEGARGARLFVRATFIRQQLTGGAEIVGERKLIGPSGERISTQTRCRITDADAATWR